jgi:decaprenylphospho-beta-D-ribofuranose 2-oxidase
MLPSERLRWLEGWGTAVGAAGYVYNPRTAEGVAEAFEAARKAGVPVVLRGAGCSYGDAALRAESVVLDLTELNRVLDWNPQTGIVEVEAGATIEDIWRLAIGHGWWPAAVTGTMKPSVGGALAMNVHGKNNWCRGTLGEHCLELELMVPDGALHRLTPQDDRQLFHAAIGAFGQLGVVTRARLQLEKVHSGQLEVRAVAARDLETMLRLVDDAKDAWEYVVGWIDAFASGRSLGRGLLHFGRHLEAGEDPDAERSLESAAQDLPAKVMGVIPSGQVWRFLAPFTNRPGMRLINSAKYLAGRTVGNNSVYRQSLAAFSFLLDYLPDWKRIYLPGGLIQHQSFVPADAAETVFRLQLEICRRRRMPSFLAVLKRHRPDPFLMSHGLDGFSLALDFPVLPGSRRELWDLVRELAEPVVAAGGKFYPAKDAALPGELYRATFTGGEIERFLELKARMDPERRLGSALADRLLYGA